MSTPVRTLRLEPLTPEAFAPYGDVVAPPAPGARAAIESGLHAGAEAPILGFNHLTPHDLPLTAIAMERHNRSSQCFMPMDVSRWVVLVAPDIDGRPDPSRIRAFLVRGDQAVNYHVGIWHHPLRVLDRPARFASLMWTTGRKEDDEEWSTLPEPLLVDV